MENDQLKPEIELPPGFRFHPSDEELIVHYLRKKASKDPLPAAIVAEVELYKLNPWELRKKAVFGEEEWFFFTPRDRKYPNGIRPNREASSGYWKAMGTDKPILSASSATVIRMKKALVFYTGRPPKANKTDWIMQEYRLPEATWTAKKERFVRLDDWVLSRVRQKAGPPGNFWEDRYGPTKEPAIQCNPEFDQHAISVGKRSAAPNDIMVRGNIYRDCQMPPFLLGNFQDFPCMDTLVSNRSFEGDKTSAQTPCRDTVSNISFEVNKAASVCKDNFKIDYMHSSAGSLNMLTRRTIEGNSEDVIFRHPNKKPTNKDRQIWEEIPQSASNDTIGTVSCSTNQMDQNNSISNVDQLSSIMMYQDPYSLWS